MIVQGPVRLNRQERKMTKPVLMTNKQLNTLAATLRAGMVALHEQTRNHSSQEASARLLFLGLALYLQREGVLPYLNKFVSDARSAGWIKEQRDVEADLGPNVH
jgi:hypothetical protein